MQFLQLLETAGISLFDLIVFVVSTIFTIILFNKTGNIKYIKEAIQDMKYRTFGYNVTENVDKKTGEVSKVSLSKSQKFNKLVPVYRLNKVTNELEATDEFIDVHEQIQSYKEEAFQSMLERFLPKLVDDTADFTNVKGDLDMLQETFEIAEEYREKFGLSDEATIQDIYKHVKNYSVELANKLKAKEVVKDEKENV